MTTPASLKRDISPPPTRRSRKQELEKSATPAAIEAGKARLLDPISYFHDHLSEVSRPLRSNHPRLVLAAWTQLWRNNKGRHGRMFVVHQHDHPIAGVHYDLRLQFSATSAISFSIPYGLPGNPNSVRPMRMAIETRVHCLWNHLVESASHASGSLLIWDTGEYEVLPYSVVEKEPETDDDDASDVEAEVEQDAQKTDSERLFEAFQSRHIKLRLHGTKLPQGYTIAMRLPSINNVQSKKPKRKRQRKDPLPQAVKGITVSDDDQVDVHTSEKQPTERVAADSDDDEDDTIRINNAYPGSENTIGSIHQRQWFLTLDKLNSGFIKATSRSEKGRWIPQDEKSGWKPFFVKGRDVERSVITGRNAAEVMQDEGVHGYVGRKTWRPILE
ncbi:hypothetical protein E4T39_02447 [Aureobasidium subglaciale]|nr:hypothetical protein E4T39_02447 [Aureobasidium subglaciale]